MRALQTDQVNDEPIRETRRAPLLSGWPAGWFMFCPTSQVRRAPVARQAFGQRLVVFRTASGEWSVLGARCVHLGADLAGGCVVGETIRCPFHHWRFDTQGRCVDIPAADEIPQDARQLAFPVMERMGGVYLYNGATAAYPLPFFEDLRAEDLQPAAPFSLLLKCPWYMVGANGVDLQHFATTHDRQLLAPPTIDHPSADVHRTVTRFGVVGQHLRDRLTRLAGQEVRMEVLDWSGTMFLVRATFRRTETFGMVSVLPRSMQETEVHVVVAVRRSSARWRRSMFDPWNAQLRRWFIHRFLQPDVARSAGTDVTTGRLIAADEVMAGYFRWLRSLHGVPL